MPEVGVSKNDASTFKPYNPNEIVGSTSPGLPYIPPASSNQCAVVAMVIVAIAVTVLTYGQAAPYLSSMLTPIATLGTISGITTVGAITGGFVAGVAGSIASQLVGKALGAVDHFSMRSAVGNGIATAITMGVSAATAGLGTLGDMIKTSQWGHAAAVAVANATSGYVGNKIAGVSNTSFSWKEIASSAVTSVVTASISNKLNFNSQKPLFGSGQFGQDLINDSIGGVVSLHTRRAFGLNDKVDYGSILTNAFGVATGNGLVRAMQGGSFSGKSSGSSGAKERAVRGLTEAEIAEVMNDPDGRTALGLLISMGQAGDGGSLVNSKPNLSGMPIPESGIYSLPLGELTEKQMLAYESAKAQYTERPLGRNAEQISADAYDVARLVQITEQLDHFNSLLPAVSLKFPAIGKEWTKISEVMTSAIVSKDVYFAVSIPGLLPRGVERITSNRDLNSIGLSSSMMVDDASGFYAAAYRNYGAKNVLIAFRGTEGDIGLDNPDWQNNILQLTGNGANSPQFQRAIQIAGNINKSDYNISFTGHSLGGGLAATAAVVVQRSAITFNAEGVLRSTIPGVTNAAWNSRNRLIQAINIEGEAVSLAQDSLKYAGTSAAAAFELKNPIAAKALQRALNLKQPLSITLKNVPSAIGTRTEISANEAFMVRNPYDAGYGNPIVVGHNAMAAHGQSQVLYALTAQYNLAAMNSSFANLMSIPKN